jgi:hypothetical protein
MNLFTTVSYYYFCYKQNNHRYKKWTDFVNDDQKANIINEAVFKLKNTIKYLQKKGYFSIVFITPNKEQVLNGGEKDVMVYNLLREHNVSAIYIVDELKKYNTIIAFAPKKLV